MDIIQIAILGIVQAISEWLPLSSKTMDTLVYTRFFGGGAESVIPLLLFLHIGTMLAAAVYFRDEIIRLAKKFLAAPTDWKAHSQGEIGFIITALFFTGVIGFPILVAEKYFLPQLDASALMVVMGAGLVITGFLLSSQAKKRWRNFEAATWKDGLLTGLMQGLSTLPGVSRAGTTTTALIWKGFDSESAFHLSFLLSIPTVFLAELVLWAAQGGLAIPAGFTVTEGLMLAASSFVFGFLMLGALLKIAHRINVAWLAFAFGIMMLVVGLIGVG
ncbi:Undecaprenyl-diphosphatase [uncultured archaeon]|nr:Undecaprenyl-diphosphatase [uncultured archaeon]